MQQIPNLINQITNCHWEVVPGNSPFVYKIVTCEKFYDRKAYKKDGTPKKSFKPKTYMIANVIDKTLAEHIVKAHNEFIKP